MSADDHLSQPQFFHGTSHALSPGDMIDPAQPHDRVYNVSARDRAYFTEDPVRASFYAHKAAEKFGGDKHVYAVQPTGAYFQDMQTKHSPENKTTRFPLRVVAEHPYTDWQATHHVR